MKLFITLLFITSFITSKAQNKIWFEQPASEWNEALPIGNGRLGGMVFGGIGYERVQLNEETIWTGSRYDFTDKKGAYKVLPDIRELLFEGEYAQAQQLCKDEFMGNDNWNMYQMLGDLYLKTEFDGAVTHYHRELSLDNAIAKTTFRVNGVTYTREYFSSHPAKAMFIRVTADKPGAVSVSASLKRPKDAEIQAEVSEITIKGQVTSGGVGIQNVNPGVRYYSALRAVSENGSITARGDSLVVDGADEVVFVLTAGTDYWGEDPEKACREDMNKALQVKYSEAKEAHIADYRSLYGRVELDLDGDDQSHVATDKRLEAVKNGGEDNGLIETYFNFGRYLLIGSSRQGDLAANLQGIWADGLTPPWSADYHININIQMNYWPAEVTNLAECHLPFVALIDSLRRHGRETAREM
ncbi:MAG: glycoside hydrolase family 95 protein [Prolixibacteraceae bacterium]|nr:glycoside hydrolase family 95 protein [Prolixibacteraceae bacterium]